LFVLNTDSHSLKKKEFGELTGDGVFLAFQGPDGIQVYTNVENATEFVSDILEQYEAPYTTVLGPEHYHDVLEDTKHIVNEPNMLQTMDITNTQWAPFFEKKYNVLTNKSRKAINERVLCPK